MSLPSSSVTRKSSDGSDPFAGLRVLVVDDDPTCLTILEKMLHTCGYDVTTTNRAEIALKLLRENRNGFDVVISDVHMPDMDGFKLLEHVGLEMDLPVIMMSADDSKSVVMKGVTHGACDYLIKPVPIEALKNIWQHVVRKKKNEWKDTEQSGSWDEGDDRQRKVQDDAVSSPANDGGWKSSKRKGEVEETDEKDDTSTLKKPRVVWSIDLHQQFVAAVNQLGIDKAVPKKILELMNVPGLTRENVASHLQKYRLFLKKLSEVSQHPGELNSSFMLQDSGFDAISPLGSFDLETLAATGQLSAQAQAACTRMTPAIKPGMPIPFVDQRNLFTFGNSKLRYGDGQQQQQQHQQQQQLMNVNKHMNLFHGIPTTMEPKQLVGLNMQANASSIHHPSSSLLMKMIPQQSHIQSRNGMVYNPVSQAATVADYTVNQISELPGNGFPLGSTPGMTTSIAGIGSDIKSSRGYAPNYDVFSEPLQHKSQEWQLPNQGMNFGGSSQQATSLQSGVNVAPSVYVHQPFIPNHKYSAGLGQQHMVTQNANQNLNNHFVDNWSRVKMERVSEVVSPGTHLFSEYYGQEDLMSVLLKQQQEGIATSGEFDFDVYTLDNISV